MSELEEVDKILKESSEILKRANTPQVKYLKSIAKHIGKSAGKGNFIGLMKLQLKMSKELGYKNWGELVLDLPEKLQKKIDESIYKEYFKNAKR